MSGLITYSDAGRREDIITGKKVRHTAKKFWIQKAVSRMKKKGTLGSFGKATAKKIKAGLAKGGKSAKKAAFAKAMKKISKK
ncbi:MAG TPA: hypothetical protein DCS09_11715 [Porphyromonadaceae bacterium]|nr:hypothetical protein [Porphyromonadaceae bacterium]